jgi:hypothetical protein
MAPWKPVRPLGDEEKSRTLASLRDTLLPK